MAKHNVVFHGRNRNVKKFGLILLLCIVPVFFLVSTLYLKFRNSSDVKTVVFINSNSKNVDHNLKKSSSAHSTHLAVIIVSDPTKAATRKAIRETWLSVKNDKVQHFFLVGTKDLNVEIIQDLQQEKAAYQDLIILSSVAESYESLTNKVLEGFKWLVSNYQFNFLLKIDDDSYVRISGLLDSLSQQPQERLYWGFFKGGANVFKKGKWREEDWFLCDTYLPYARGGGYILSSDLVHYLAASASFLQQYKSEDVSVGLWLSPLKINRVHDTRFDTEYKSRGCFNSYLITHKQSPGEMREKHRSYIKTEKLCPAGEVRLRYSYNYNWTVLPSQCCKNIDPELP